MQVHFFSYGAFSRDQIHFSKISNFIVAEKRALVKGEMYLLRCGFPMLVPSEQGEWIEGEWLQLEVPESFIPILDGLMGFDPQRGERCLLQRQECSIFVDEFSQIQATTYTMNPKKLNSFHKKISGSEWKNQLNENPPLVNQLHERQKHYISQLSRSKGRDIVPIKLDLYRELMNMELIVDKGRRLALTPLGKEAALFI